MAIPENADDIKVKKMSGARHIVETKLKQDNLKGTLTGEGHMRVRLQHGETVEKIKQNLEKQGISVKMNTQAPSSSRKQFMTQRDLVEMRVIANEVRKMFPAAAAKQRRAQKN